MSETKLILLFALQVCHWLADYSHLSMSFMLAAKKSGKPLSPIFAHAMIHGALMSLVLGFFMERNWLWIVLVLFQIATHFVIDVWKGKMNVWFPCIANSENKEHWYIFGLDQMFHQVVIILMVYWA